MSIQLFAVLSCIATVVKSCTIEPITTTAAPVERTTVSNIVDHADVWVKECRQMALDQHNVLRARHLDTPPLVQGNYVVVEAAQKWADNSILTKLKINSDKKTRMLRWKATEGECGENIWDMSVVIPLADAKASRIGRKATKNWYYPEYARYDNLTGTAKSDANDRTISHFTQLVWSKTTQVGIGCAKNAASNRFVVVAVYCEAGNLAGENLNQVMPLTPAEYEKEYRAALTTTMPPTTAAPATESRHSEVGM